MPTYCFIDEFQNFVTPSIDTVMAEARKYRLYMSLANQVISQNMERGTKRAVLGNTALKFAGDNEPDSIEVMAKQMGNLKQDRFNGLPKYSFFYYDKLNKASGVNTLRVPDFLVNQNSRFFMKKEDLKDVFKYLVYDSGYYRKVEKAEIIKPISDTQGNVYDPNFEVEW